MNKDPSALKSRYRRGFRRYTLMSMLLVMVLVGGAGAWAAIARIDGAIISTGTFGVESRIKRVQHSEGGTIKKLLVANNDTVKAGDVLVELDDTILRTELETTRSSLDEYIAIEARLLAEQIEADKLVLTEQARALTTGSDAFHTILKAQNALMTARRESLQNRIKQLGDQIGQIEEQVRGLEFQHVAKKGELDLIDDELADLDTLLKKNLVPKSRVITMRRQKTRLEGELGMLVSQIAGAKTSISERRIQIIQAGEETRAGVLDQLQGVRIKKAGLVQQKAAIEDRIARLKVRASQDGRVHERSVNTIGGVVAAGEVLLSIVPEQDRLVIEGRVSPLDVDQVYVGQQARVRAASLNMRHTPELNGKIISVSPDVSLDSGTRQSYYSIRIALTPEELERLGDVEILPGMPVEAFIVTGDRTVVEYLLEPLRIYVSKAFRET